MVQDKGFGDWRLNVFWAAISIAAAIAGFTFGWLWRDRPGAISEVSLLSAMTAFGTVGAVIWAVLAAHNNDRKSLAANERYVSTYLLANRTAWEDSCRTVAMLLNSLAAIISDPEGQSVPPGIFSAAEAKLEVLMLPNEVIASIGGKSADKGRLLAEISMDADELKRHFYFLHLLGNGSGAFLEYAIKNRNAISLAFDRCRRNLASVSAPNPFSCGLT